MLAKKRKIDETPKDVQMANLKAVCPWIPQFTPTAEPTKLAAPPARPSSPFSGQPLRTKDLIPVNLIRETADNHAQGSVKFICSVSRNTITNQKVVVIKTTGTLMLESIAEKLAYPSMTCPITGKKFSKNDIIEVAQSASGFSSTGNVIASKFKPKN